MLGGVTLERYEYKFIKQESKLGIMQGKEIEVIEKEWNELGKNGWRFCMEDKFGRLIFMRKI